MSSSPDVDYLARMVRIKIAAGKKRGEITSWLVQEGLSLGQAQAFLADFPEPGVSDRWERRCSRGCLVVVAVLSVTVLVLVLVQRPWEVGRWTSRIGNTKIEPWSGWGYFCFAYAVAMTVLWFLAMRFGQFLDSMRDPSAPRGIGPMVILVLLLTVGAFAALLALS
jgi:hypothetical protein